MGLERGGDGVRGEAVPHQLTQQPFFVFSDFLSSPFRGLNLFKCVNASQIYLLEWWRILPIGVAILDVVVFY
jgi:hypothetical protein